MTLLLVGISLVFSLIFHVGTKEISHGLNNRQSTKNVDIPVRFINIFYHAQSGDGLSAYQKCNTSICFQPVLSWPRGTPIERVCI